ncbi:dihydrofolate reductase [uncultured Methylovirgula sp.]|uniref:dihydrofolate reductase n=1 Tax=uncultured Methylovirgula sp. TaxID=1285960 RepID=UPI002638209C|nr:dihydrofolate reductase [uncultured Methylovirgula sp.]
MSLPLVAIVAVADNGVIGRGNALPWHISADLKRFRALTLGKPLIMGRKTFASLGRALPGRETIVVTRDPSFKPPAGVYTASDIDTALALAEIRAKALGAAEIVIAGGGEIYAAVIDRLDRLHVTYVHCRPEGDAFFPPLDWSHWREICREDHAAEQDGDAGYAFVDYIRS